MTGITIPATSDLYDEHGDTLESCDTQFTSFGRRGRFRGRIVTIRCREDNALLKATLSEPGHDKILVVDGGGSLRCALMGDMIAATAIDNGWTGVIINGAVRDVELLNSLDIGVKALGSNPRKSSKTGAGQRDLPVSFGGALFTPGREVLSDADGIVVLP
jgi:regulator of ribonuclease activity A